MLLDRSLRLLAERFSRGVVPKRRPPTEFGGARLYVTPEARLNLWHHNLRKCDPALLELAREVIKPARSSLRLPEGREGQAAERGFPQRVC